MNSKIMQVFYDENCLPFKDKERTVHYPVVGNGFNGFNNTQKIRFYVDRIGGTINTTWVATTKLPNGQLLYELLSNVAYDDEIGEYYVEFTISDLYTEIKGDIFIGLSGYQGGVQVEEDEDTGIYTIVGTPTIQATGTIKLTLAYAPQVLNKKTLGLTDLQQILGYLADFMKQETSIVVIANTSVDVSGFEDGQMFLCLADQLLYKLVSGSLVAQKSGYIPYTGATANVDLGTRSISALRFISEDTYRENNLLYIVHDGVSNTYTFRVKNANTSDYVATENYVDNNIYEMESASVVLSDSNYAYLLKNNVRIHYGDLFYEKAKETESQVVFYSVDYQRTTTGGSTGYTTRTTKKITLTKSSQQLDAADINDLSYNKEQTDKNFAHSLFLQLNTTNYKLSVYLYDKEGNALSTQTIDLPLESIVVSATYYDTYTYDGTTYQKVIVIVLATTDVPTIIPVGDLVDGLATTTQLTNGLALKVNKSDIADNLTTNDATKVLSAKQGYILKGSVDANTTAIQSKANNSEVVHKTGNETIGGNKTFTGGVNLGNFVASSINSTLRPLYDNSRDLGQDYNGQYYWRDLYLKGKWKDGTNEKSLQDLINDNNALKAEITQLRLEFEEAVIEEGTVSYSYLQWEALPNNVSGYPIIYSGGSEMTNVKGNSCVVNQLVQNGNFVDTDGWTAYRSTESVSNNVLSNLLSDNSSTSFGYARLFNAIVGHKYLIIMQYKHNVDVSKLSGLDFKGNSFDTIYATDLAKDIWHTLCGIQTAISVGSYIQITIRYNDVADMQVGVDKLESKNFNIFDLTLMGLDSLTTVDQVRSALLARGINIDEYNPYNEGSIKNSKPTSLVVHHFNLWDEEWELGGYNATTGQTIVSTSQIRSKNTNPISVRPNTTYYLKIANYGGNYLGVYFYDKNDNFIGYNEPNTTTHLLTTPNNCFYIRFSVYSGYGTTYNNDICINISNATLNGTYKPYQAPNTYALDLPILRGVDNVKDDKEKVRIGVIDLGTLTFTHIESSGRHIFDAIISDLKQSYNSNIPINALCPLYNAVSTNTTWGNMDMAYSISSGSKSVSFINNSYTDANTFKNAMSGVYLYYELATPTDQVAITLPDDIVIENGDSFEVVYDNNDNCGADFDFAVATNKLA